MFFLRQGKFNPGNSMSIDGAISEQSFRRPAVFGTLTAADAISRGGSFQFPGDGGGHGRSPLAPDNGPVGSTAGLGVFNLPRYYPKYRTFRQPNGAGSLTRLDGREAPFYPEQEPVYAKPRKTKDKAASRRQSQVFDGGEKHCKYGITLHYTCGRPAA